MPNNSFLIIKSENIENSRIQLKGLVLQVPSNQIKVTFISDFFLFHIEIEEKCGLIMWVNYLGVGGGVQRVCYPLPPPSQIIGGLPPLPTPMQVLHVLSLCEIFSTDAGAVRQTEIFCTTE